MEPPLASLQLPKGFENWPDSVLEDILFRLNWSDLHNVCQTYPRVNQLCQDQFWLKLQKKHFPRSKPENGFYQDPFHNYLVAAIQNDTDEIFSILKSLGYVGWYRGKTPNRVLRKVHNAEISALQKSREEKSQILGDYLSKTYPGYYVFEDLETDNLQTFLDYYNELKAEEPISDPSQILNIPLTILPDGTSRVAHYYYPLWDKLVDEPDKIIRVDDPRLNYYFIAWKAEGGPINILINRKDEKATLNLFSNFFQFVREAGLTSRVVKELFQLPDPLTFEFTEDWF